MMATLLLRISSFFQAFFFLEDSRGKKRQKEAEPRISLIKKYYSTIHIYCLASKFGIS